jgi:dTDP-4-dehydrorhamnose 3,5-epimerase
MSRFDVSATPLPGLRVVHRQRLGDSRGFLSRLFCADELAAAGFDLPIAQVNHTFTARKGTVRGMHFQLPPHAEIKLVTCLRGEVWDVAVDVREGSATYLRWYAELLSADNGCALLIPAGFAHGFQALSDDVELLYCHSAAHAPQAEGALNPQDERLAIAWPLAISELSARDAGHARITESFKGVAT